MRTEQIIELVHQEFKSRPAGEQRLILLGYAKSELQLNEKEAVSWQLPDKTSEEWATIANLPSFLFLTWFSYNYLLTNLTENPVGRLLRTEVRKEYRRQVRMIDILLKHAESDP